MSNFKERYWTLWEEARDLNPKISREQFADTMGVTPGQSNGWLRGTSEPDCEALAVISKNAKANVHWLIGMSNVRTPEPICPLIKELPSEAVNELVEFVKYIRFKYNYDKYKL